MNRGQVTKEVHESKDLNPNETELKLNVTSFNSPNNKLSNVITADGEKRSDY